MTAKGIQDEQVPHQKGLGEPGGLKTSESISAAKKRTRIVLDQSIRELASYNIKLIAEIFVIMLFFLGVNIIAGWNPFGVFTTIIIVSYTALCLVSNRRE